MKFKIDLPTVRFSILAFLFFASCFLGGCYTQNKATKQVYKAHDRYPGAVAIILDKLYSYVQTSDSTVIEYRTGETKYLPGDTIVVDCDSAILRREIKTVRTLVRVPCPPSSIRVDTSLIRRKIEMESTLKLAAKDALLAQEVAKNADLTNEVQDREATIRFWRSVSIWGGIIALVLLGLMWFLKR